MKNLFISSGVILIILNTLAGLLITKYQPFNYILVDLCLLISTVFTYLIATSNISPGFKIGLNILFSLTGLIKIICCISARPHFNDNYLIVATLGIISFEIICLLSAFAMKKFT